MLVCSATQSINDWLTNIDRNINIDVQRVNKEGVWIP